MHVLRGVCVLAGLVTLLITGVMVVVRGESLPGWIVFESDRDGDKDDFGIPYSPLSCADEAITRYASKTHAVGVRLTATGLLDVYAPFGLEDIFDMIVRPNYALPDNKPTHDRKAARAKAVWPEVTVIDWEPAMADSSAAPTNDGRHRR